MKLANYLLLVTLFISCQNNGDNNLTNKVNGESIFKHVEELASDKYVGRMPCEAGEPFNNRVPYFYTEEARN